MLFVLKSNFYGGAVFFFKKYSIFCFCVLLIACSSSSQPAKVEPIALEVFKSPNCGCCGQWVTHLEEFGLVPTINNQDTLDTIKEKLGVPSNLQSCHTGVSRNGYFFEGHIPAKIITEFLANPPADMIGLTVPGMPAGSPGMEMGGRFNPYSVYWVKKDGSTGVYRKVGLLQDQY